MKYLVVVVLVVVGSNCLAVGPVSLADQRNIVFDRLSTESGLSQSLVTSVVQDQEGFVWIGTQEGLNRYDGYTFDISYSKDKTVGLLHDTIWSLLVDDTGNLWVGTDEGLNLKPRDTVTFTAIPLLQAERQPRIHSLLFDSVSDQLWIGSSQGLFVLKGDLGVTQVATVETVGEVRTLAALPGGRILVGSASMGLLVSDQAGSLVRIVYDREGARILGDTDVRSLLVDSASNVWVGTHNDGLTKLDSNLEHATPLNLDSGPAASLSSNRIRKLYEDKLGSIWVGTDNGLFLYQGEDRFLQFKTELSNARSLSDNSVVDIYQDEGGVVWVGTFNGISKWNALVGRFPYFQRPPESELIGSSNNVTSFAQDDAGNVWIGTLGGLLFWNGTSGKLRALRSEDIGLLDERVMSLVSYQGEIWAGTMASGIQVFRDGVVVESYTKERFDNSSISSNAITGFFKDSQDRLWITTWGGGVNLSLGNGSFQRYPDGGGDFSDLRCMDIIEVGSNEFWIATDGGGITVLDDETGETRIIDADREENLASNHLISLHQSQDGVWIGSLDSGLSFFEFASKEFRTLTKANGLVSDAVYGILEDDTGRLWISSRKGLSSYSPTTMHFEHYDVSHGLQGSDFNSGAYAALPDGSFLFGGINGFNAFFPSNIHINQYVPPVHITGFKLFNQEVSLSKYVVDGSIRLEHDDSVMGFSFAALDYTSSGKNRYRYKLIGFDRDWVDLLGNREVTYTNLDPGTYTFRVQGSNNDGVWNEEGASIALIVDPAPWQTWWAYTAYSALVVFLFYLVLRYNSDRLQRDAERRYSARLQLYIESLEEASDCILIADSSGTLLFANNTITEGLNKTPSEVIGESLWGVLFENEDDVSRARSQLEANGRYHGEVLLAGSDGSTVTHDVTIAAVQQTSHEERAYVGISRDVTQRKITEAELEDYRKNLERLVEVRTEALQKEIAENKAIQLHLADSLQEKELLIKEVHHRVKNNMQVISSLLSIQAHGAGDEVYSNMLNESQQRIKSMALIHETLYQSKDLLKIDFQEYIESLTTSLSRSYSVPGVSVYVDVNVDHVELDLETAVPCGLVINELVSNSLKHAFHGKEGTAIIDIDFVANDCRYDLRIADNGIGLPANFDLHKNTSMGMEIVSILTTQLEGELSAHSDQGAVFEISFPRVVHG